MANQEQLTILKRSVGEWNWWRLGNPDVTIDLSGVDLTGAYLSRVNLEGANLSGADLKGADFWRADLTRANLKGATLPSSWMEECSKDILSILRSEALNGEVAFLKKALEEGRVDGSIYDEDCACLIGTLANAGDENVYDFCNRIDRAMDSFSPAEQFFMLSKPGDDISNPCGKKALELCDKVLKEKENLSKYLTSIFLPL